MKPDSTPVASSTSGYRALIGALQLAHLPPSASQLTTGMFCSAVIGALHAGQAERGVTMLNGGSLSGLHAAGSASSRAFGAQLVVHHDRHAMDHDVEEAADEQAQHHAKPMNNAGCVASVSRIIQ